MSWSNVVTGFDGADETINFGARHVALVENSVYETKTVATIESTSEDISNAIPACRALYSENFLGVTLDKTFLLFGDSGSSLIINLSFETIIDTYQFSPDRRFAIFSLNSDVLVFIDLANPGKIIFKKKIPITESDSAKVVEIIARQSEDVLKLIVIFNSGKILMSEINTNNLLNSKNEAEIEFQVLNQAVSEKVLIVEEFHQCFDDYVKVFLGTENTISLWSEKDKNTYVYLKLNYGSQIKQIKSNGLFTFALTTDGRLIQICHRTFSVIRESNENVTDIMFIENSAHSTSELLLLTDNELILMEPFSFAVKFKLKTNGPSFLVDGMTDCEDLFYLEGVNESGKVDAVRLKAVTVNQPEMRLGRLLSRRKFVEAEEFAKHYDLLEDVQKAKVRWLLGELHLNKSPEESRGHFEELFSLVKIIKDNEFVGECCIKATPHDIIKTKQLLKYAWDRLSKLKDQNSTITKHLKNLKNLLNAVGSFLLTFGEAGTAEEWLIFSTANPLILCENFLSKGQIKEAILICNRNKFRIKSEISIEMAYSLFEIIPLEVSPESTLDWLNCFLPIVLSSHSQSLDKFVDWIIRKAKYWEHQDSDFWPRKALEFSKACSALLINLMTNNDINDKFSLQQGFSLPNSAVNVLNHFSLNLNHLCILSEEYCINMLYNNYIQHLEQTSVLLHSLFDYVPTNLISKFIENFVTTVFADRCKDVDQIISSYVKKRSSDCYMGDHSWEDRCILFINCIEDLTEQLSTIKAILSKVSIPLSSDIEGLIESIKHLKHPLVHYILKEESHVAKKVVLKKYELECEDLDEFIACSLRIFELVKEEGLEDVKFLLAHKSTSLNLEPYLAMWMTAIPNGWSDTAFSIIKKELPTCKVVSVSKQMIAVIDFELKIKLCSSEVLEKYVQTLEDILSYCSCEESPEAKYVVEVALNCKNIHKINTEHQTAFKLNDMYGIQKEEVVEFCISNEIENSKDPIVSETSESIETLKSNLMRIAVDFNLAFEKCVLEFISQCVAQEKLQSAAYFIQYLYQDNFFDKHTTIISQLLESMLTLFLLMDLDDKDQDVARILYETASSLVIVCSTVYVKRNVHILNISKLFVVPPQKPEWSTIYEDPFDVRHHLLTPSVGNALMNCIRRVPVGIDNVLLNEDLEKVLQSTPNDLISFSQIYTLVWLLLQQGNVIDAKTLKKISKIASLRASAVLLNMLGARSFELNLALILLHHFQPDQAVQWLNNVSNKISFDDLKWNNALGLLGKHYCELHQELTKVIPPEMFNFFHEIYVVTSWGMKIQQYEIPSSEACTDVIEDRKKLLKKLIRTPNIKLDVLEQYCSDMKLDVQKCLLLYLEHVLLSWKPIFSVSKEDSGKKFLVLENNTDELLKVCRNIVFRIENESTLSKLLLETVWDQVNTYYYEVFLVILEIIPKKYCDHLPPYKLILNFLITYTRVGEIQDSEKVEWHASNPSNQTIPEIAKYRLPIKKFPCESVKALKHEMTLETYNLWLLAPVWASNARNQDLICSMTITNLKPGDAEASTKWLLHSRNKELLQQIEQCLQNIQSYEIAVASLYFVVNYVMPPGVDQVQAAQLCFMKAEQWADNDHNEAALAGKAKAEKKYLTISTVHILHKYGLGKPEYIKLALQPVDLICALYHEPCLLEEGSFSSKPDVNKAVECIAALQDVNMANIYTLELLPKWLDAEIKSVASEFQLPDTRCNAVTSQYSDNVKRACYMLLGCKDLGKVESYLVGFAFPRIHDENRKHVGVRLRALQCLTAITTTEKLQLITGRHIDAVKSHMQVLEIVYLLESYGCSYTINRFEQTSKEVIIQNLLKKPTNGKIKLASHIARCYDLTNPKIWNEIVQKMIMFMMRKDLEEVLPLIEEIMIDPGTIRLVWSRLIESAIASEEHEKILDLIRSCPDSSYLDIKMLIHYFKTNYNEDAVKYLTSLDNT